MDSRGEDRFGKKQRQHFGKGDTGVGHANQYLASGGKRGVHDDGRSSALLGPSEVVWVFGEGEVAGLGAVGRGEPIEHKGRVAQDFARKVFGYFSSGKR